MATSGNFVTSDSGQGTSQFYGRMIFEWWETGRGISGAVGYHNISYHLKTYGGDSIHYQMFYNGSMNVDGAGYSWGVTKAYGAGATVFGDYGNTLYTDGAGNRGFGASAQGGIFNNTINTSGSGSWGLDWIPLHSNIVASPGNIDDEASTYFTTYNNPAGGAIDTYLDLPALGVGGYNRAFNYGSGNPVSMAPDIATIRSQMAHVSSTTIRYVVHDAIGGADNWTFQDYTLTIKNDTGQANPSFSDFSFATGPGTLAVTGSNSYIVQGVSSLTVTVPTANKATPNKGAIMDHYTVNIGGYSNNLAYSPSADVAQTISTISDVTGARTLSVTAVDSRGNSKVVNKTINILPYGTPVANPVATRANGFDDALILSLNGFISPLTVSGVDKNHLTLPSGATQGLQYRFVADGGDINAVAWTDVPNTVASGTGVVTATNQSIVIAAQGTASSAHSYKIQARLQDAFFVNTVTLNISSGTPIFRIGADRVLYYNEWPLSNPAVLKGTSGSSIVADARLNGAAMLTALSTNLTISAPTNPYDGKRLLYCIKDDGNSRALTWDSVFVPIGVSLPATTSPGKWMYVGAIYNSTAGQWHVVGVNIQG